jgi:hypothetical protein
MIRLSSDWDDPLSPGFSRTLQVLVRADKPAASTLTTIELAAPVLSSGRRASSSKRPSATRWLMTEVNARPSGDDGGSRGWSLTIHS